MLLTEQEQIKGLMEVQKLVHRANGRSVIYIGIGDVASLAPLFLGSVLGVTEITFADGEYDLWRSSNLIESNLSANQAAVKIMDEWKKSQ